MNDDARKQLHEDVRQSLRLVIDPELGENLVDLGLIYRIDIDDGGEVRIDMSTTTRGCPAAAYLKDAVHSAVSTVPGIGHVEVLLTYDPPWSSDRIDGTIRYKFAGGNGGLHQ